MQYLRRLARSEKIGHAVGSPRYVGGGKHLLEEAFERYTDIAERASRRLFLTSLALANAAS
jgi:hypothetical protein